MLFRTAFASSVCMQPAHKPPPCQWYARMVVEVIASYCACKMQYCTIQRCHLHCGMLKIKHRPVRSLQGMLCFSHSSPLCSDCMQEINSSNGGSSSSGQRHSVLSKVHRLSLSAFVLMYPYVHASIEAVKFVYQLGYLLDVFETHSPVLHLLGQRLLRLTGPEMVRGAARLNFQGMHFCSSKGQHYNQPDVGLQAATAFDLYICYCRLQMKFKTIGLAMRTVYDSAIQAV